MPYINIQITDESVTRSQKQELITGATNLMRDVLGKDPATTFVILDIIPTDHWGISGEMVTERRKKEAAARRKKP